MKTYACDKCGAEFHREDDDYDELCPECFSNQTVLLSDFLDSTELDDEVSDTSYDTTGTLEDDYDDESDDWDDDSVADDDLYDDYDDDEPDDFLDGPDDY